MLNTFLNLKTHLLKAKNLFFDPKKILIANTLSLRIPT